jgi:hypothetical protein
MTNWCQNVVTFFGKDEQVMDVLAYFNELIYHYGSGDLKDLDDFRHLSFLQDGRIWFESRGSPAIATLREIAEEFDVGFKHRFSDTNIYGEALRENNLMVLTVLDEEDLRSVGYDDDAMLYTVGKNVFPARKQALEYLLEEKRLALINNEHSQTRDRGRKR